MEGPDEVMETPPIRYTKSPTQLHHEQGQVDMWRERIVRFYQTWNPSKVGEVDAILEAHRGAEAEVYAAIVEKYMPRERPESNSSTKSFSAKKRSVAKQCRSPASSPIAVPSLTGSRPLARDPVTGTIASRSKQHPPTPPAKKPLTRDPVTGKLLRKRQSPPTPLVLLPSRSPSRSPIPSHHTPVSIPSPTPSPESSVEPADVNRQLTTVMGMLQEQRTLFEELQHKRPDNEVFKVVEEMKLKIEKETERSERLERELRDLKELWKEKYRQPLCEDPPSRGVSAGGVMEEGYCEPRELACHEESGIQMIQMVKETEEKKDAEVLEPEGAEEEIDDVALLEEAVHELSSQIRGIHMTTPSPLSRRVPGVTTVAELMRDDSDSYDLDDASSSSSGAPCFGQHSTLPGRVILS